MYYKKKSKIGNLKIKRILTLCINYRLLRWKEKILLLLQSLFKPFSSYTYEHYLFHYSLVLIFKNINFEHVKFNWTFHSKPFNNERLVLKWVSIKNRFLNIETWLQFIHSLVCHFASKQFKFRRTCLKIFKCNFFLWDLPRYYFKNPDFSGSLQTPWSRVYVIVYRRSFKILCAVNPEETKVTVN